MTIRWDAVVLSLALAMQAMGAAATIAALFGVAWLDIWPALGIYVAGVMAYVGAKIAS